MATNIRSGIQSAESVRLHKHNRSGVEILHMRALFITPNKLAHNRDAQVMHAASMMQMSFTFIWFRAFCAWCAH